eukprot:754753-Hanusia_phi.AAC.6
MICDLVGVVLTAGEQVGEVVTEIAHMAAEDQLDLVLAADVLVYFGNLEPFMQASQQLVRGRAGLIAFTVELADENVCGEEGEAKAAKQGWKLTVTGRYAHCRQDDEWKDEVGRGKEVGRGGKGRIRGYCGWLTSRPTGTTLPSWWRRPRGCK